MAIPNGSKATAIAITLPASVVLDTSLIAPDTEAWYVLTTAAARYLLSIIVSNTTTEFPGAYLFESDGTTPVGSGGPEADRLDPVNLPVSPLTTYYLTIVPNGGTAVITVAVAEAPIITTAPGDILILGEQPESPRAVAVLKATGKVITSVPFKPSSGSADSTPSGVLLNNTYGVASAFGEPLQLCNLQILTVIGDVVKPELNKSYGIRSDKVNRFFISPLGSPVSGKVYTVTEAGVVTQVATIAGTILTHFDVAVGGHTMYYVNLTAGTGWPIHTWNLDTDAAGADFNAGVANFRVGFILVLADGTVVVSYFNPSNRLLDFLRLYDSSGGFLRDIAVTVGFTTGVLMRDENDPTSFWWFTFKSSNFTENCRNIKVSDGSSLISYTIATRANFYLEDLTALADVFWAGASLVQVLIPVAGGLPGALLKLDTDLDGAGGGGGGGGSHTSVPGGGYTGLGGDDDGEEYTASVKTRAFGNINKLGTIGQLQQPIVVARKALTSLQLTIDKDRGRETQVNSASLVATGTETRVIRKFEGAGVADATLVQFTLGDRVDTADRWTIDHFQAKHSEDGDV